jgi:hypothetical protein
MGGARADFAGLGIRTSGVSLARPVLTPSEQASSSLPTLCAVASFSTARVVPTARLILGRVSVVAR